MGVGLQFKKKKGDDPVGKFFRKEASALSVTEGEWLLRTAARLALSGAALYGAAALGIWLFADRMTFRPPRRTGNGIAALTLQAGEVQVAAEYLYNPEAWYTVLFSHGNSEDLEAIYPLLLDYRDHGFSVLSYDYPGYGMSGGVPTERGSIEAARAAYRWLVEELRLPPERIIIHGYSLGGGPSTVLALEERCAGLVLESTFTTAFRTVTKIALFPLDRFDNRRIRKASVPLMIIHGRKDQVVPFTHGVHLYRLAPGPKIFFEVPDAGHGDLHVVSGERYWQAWQDFLALIEAQKKAPELASA